MGKLKIGPVNAASPTPLLPDMSFDRKSARKLAKRWVDIGLDGVLLLGTMGEGHFVSDAVRNACVEAALEDAGGKLNICCCAADMSRARMMERALRYAKMGAPCVFLCLPPHNTPQRSIDDVRAVAEACPVPCGYYDYPEESGTPLLVTELAQILSHPNIHIFKDSSLNPLISHAINSKQFRPKNVAIFDGIEYRNAYTRSYGYDGAMYGGAVLTGKWVRALWDMTADGVGPEAVKMDSEKSLFFGNVFNRLERPVRNIAGHKYALKVLGVFDHETTAVNQQLDEPNRARIRAAVKKHKAWLV